MRDTLTRVEFGQALVNLGQEHKALNGVIKCRVDRQILQGLEDSIACGLS